MTSFEQDAEILRITKGGAYDLTAYEAMTADDMTAWLHDPIRTDLELMEGWLSLARIYPPLDGELHSKHQQIMSLSLCQLSNRIVSIVSRVRKQEKS